VDHRASLDDVEKRKFLTLPGLEVRPLGRPARSQSLYRLRYPAPNMLYVRLENTNSIRGGIGKFLDCHCFDCLGERR
jgi:hypothetical protein